jgi:HPt (histidine-containing phosphotransfer) domain-containing protein
MVILNLEEGLSRVRGNKKLFRRMLSLFDASEEFQKLQALLDAKDYPQAGDVAHTIKGMVGNLSMTALFETSTVLMNELRQGVYDDAHIAQYQDALDQTRVRVKALEAELDAELA